LAVRILTQRGLPNLLHGPIATEGRRLLHPMMSALAKHWKGPSSYSGPSKRYGGGHVEILVSAGV
jgi:hypothetical protein